MMDVIIKILAIFGLYYIGTLIVALFNKAMMHWFNFKVQEKIVYKDCDVKSKETNNLLPWEKKLTLLLRKEFETNGKKKLSCKFLWSLYICTKPLFENKFKKKVSPEFFLNKLKNYTYGIKLPTVKGLTDHSQYNQNDYAYIKILKGKLE